MLMDGAIQLDALKDALSIEEFPISSESENISTFGGFNGFQNDYIPHYTIILIMFIVSIALATVSFLIQNKKTSGDKVFLLVAVNITIVILSVLTESSIMDYVDINGLGVNPKFTILMLLMVLINYVSLALMARRHKRQIAGTQKADSN